MPTSGSAPNVNAVANSADIRVPIWISFIILIKRKLGKICQARTWEVKGWLPSGIIDGNWDGGQIINKSSNKCRTGVIEAKWGRIRRGGPGGASHVSGNRHVDIRSAVRLWKTEGSSCGWEARKAKRKMVYILVEFDGVLVLSGTPSRRVVNERHPSSSKQSKLVTSKMVPKKPAARSNSPLIGLTLTWCTFRNVIKNYDKSQ